MTYNNLDHIRLLLKQLYDLGYADGLAGFILTPNEIVIDSILREIVSLNLTNLVEFVYAGSDKVDDPIADFNNNNDNDEWLLNK